MTTPMLRHWVLARVLATALAAAATANAEAQSDLSQASGLSMLPVAVSVAAPVMLLSAGVTLTVVAVDASARGTVWVLERASDGARISIRFAGEALEAGAVSIGTGVAVSVIGTGYVLSAAGRAIAFIPNEIGASLLYNEQLTR